MEDRNSNKINDLEKDMVVVQHEMRQFSDLINKLDIAIEKISEVSNSISRLLVLHEEKLSNHSIAIEQNKVDSKVIVEKFEESVRKIETSISKIDERIGSVERMKYLIMGGWVVLAYVLTKVQFFLTLGQ